MTWSVCAQHDTPFLQAGSLILCAPCASILESELSSSVESPPSADTAAGTDAPANDATVSAAINSNPRSPNPLSDGTTERFPAHSQAVVSNSAFPVGEPAPVAASIDVADSSPTAAAGVHDMPDIPDFLRRARAA